MTELAPIIQQSLQLIDEQLKLKHERDLERLKILKHIDRDNIHNLMWRLYVLLNDEFTELEAITSAVKRVNKQLAFSKLGDETAHAQQVLHNILEGLLEKLLEVKGFIRQQQRVCNDLTEEAESLGKDEDEVNSFTSKAFIQVISLMNKEVDASKNAIRHCDGVLPILNDLEATEKTAYGWHAIYWQKRS